MGLNGFVPRGEAVVAGIHFRRKSFPVRSLRTCARAGAVGSFRFGAPRFSWRVDCPGSKPRTRAQRLRRGICLSGCMLGSLSIEGGRYTYPAQDMCCILRQVRGLGAFFGFWLRFSQSAWRLGKLNIPEGCCTFLKIVEDDRTGAGGEMNWLCSRGMVSAGDRDKTCRDRMIERLAFEGEPTKASDPRGGRGASEPASGRLRFPLRSARCGTSRSENSVLIDSTNPISSPPRVSSPIA
jgi:hypothetical protein